MTDWKRDWNKITLQSVVGAIAAFSAAAVIIDPQHKLLAIAVASAATSALAAYTNTMKGASEAEAAGLPQPQVALETALPPSDRDATPPPVVPPVVPLPK